MKLNIIIGNRTERLPKLLNELESNGITDFKFWEGMYLPSIKESINRSHKQIVQWAMDNDIDEVCIAEDDLKFFSTKSWEFYLSKKPNWWEYDIYLSMVFMGDIKPNNKVDEFTGLTMYCVSKKFYDIFLSTPSEGHLDLLLARQGDYHVCMPFVATQFDGISGNTGKYEEYETLLQNRPRLNL